MKISPWFLAFILLSSIAAYELLRRTSILELFTVRSDQAKCETSYQNCLESGKTNLVCTTEYNACNLGVSAVYDTSGNYQALLKASTLRTQKALCESTFNKCLASGKDSKACTLEYNKCTLDVAAKYDTSTNYQALLAIFNSPQRPTARPYNPNISPPPGVNTIVPNYPDSSSSSWPWDNTTSVPSNTDISGSWHTLAKAWDNTMGGITHDISTHHTYTPSSNSVLPTYIPTAPLPTLTAVVPTDVGTGADAILAGSPLTPSLRQMIRNDISGTVKKEFDDVKSRYEIQYNYQ